ncbi:MAG: AAA family ATPase [Deltaproteobacteria bacterium]|nr:AAA family ATPase [Deltaproteobacteria bacterium]
MGPGVSSDGEADLAPGARVGGRYQVDAALGRGGMGAVYRATDTIEARPVALKLLHQRVFAEQRALRTKHEFRAMVQLRHPRMVEVRDYGFLPSGAPFFVMELLEGRDLAGAVGLPLPTIYRIVAGLADALGFMHARGSVHRDIKPANVLLRTQADGAPDVKLLDFGTVELTGGGAGTIAGTMRYLAPESHHGAAADPRVDLYALGVLAYELSTGAYPFAGGVAAELLEAKLAGLPPLDEVRADVPAPFARLVEDLLAPEPSARPRSCQEVSARLAGLSAGLDSGFELGRELHTPALAGRKAELGRLRADLGAATEGHARGLFIVAPAGAGKTRIFEEALLEVRVTGTQVATVAPREFGRQPYETVRALISKLLAQPGAEAALAEAGGAEALGALHPARARGEASRGDPVAEREAMHAGLARFVASLSAHHPLVLAVDDIHIADSASLEALGALLAAAPRARLAVVGTVREGEAVSPALRRLFELPRASKLELLPLGADQIRELLVTTLGPCAPDAALLADIERTSGGNVYFILEILRSMVARGAVTRTRTGAVLPARLDVADAPRSLGDALLARVAGASALARRMATALALLGREADIESLAAILGAPEDDFLDALLELRRGEFVDIEDGQVRVHHPRVREVLAAALAPAERSALHRRVAEVLESRGSDRTRDAAELAVHWAGAGERRRALGLWVAAGDGRYEALAFHDAGQAYRRAEQLLDAAPARQRRALERMLCDRLGRIGFTTEHGAAIPYLERAIALHLSSGILWAIPTLRKVLGARLAMVLALVVTGLGNALRLRRRPFKTALQSLFDAFAASSYLSTCYSYTGRFRRGLAAAEALEPFVYARDKLPQAAVEIGRGTPLFFMGRFDQAIACSERAVRIFESDRSAPIAAHDRERGIAGMLAVRVWCDLARGHVGASEWTQRLEAAVAASPTVVLEAWLMQVQAFRGVLKGRSDDVLAVFTAAQRLPPLAQVDFLHESIRGHVAVGLLEMGRVAEANDLADGVIERATRNDNPVLVARALLVRALCQREWGHHAESERCLRQAIERAAHPDCAAQDVSDNLELALAESELAAGRHQRAAALARAAFARTQDYQRKNDLLRLRARRLLGRVALAQGQHEEALEALSFSLRMARDLELPLETARSAHALAALHEATGAAAEQDKMLALCERTLRAIDNRYQLHRLGFSDAAAPRPRRLVGSLSGSSGNAASGSSGADAGPGLGETPAALAATELSDRPGVVRPSSDDPLAPTVDGSVPTRLAARGTPVSTPAASAGTGKPAPAEPLAATVDDLTPGRRA